jgi:hypothetical protein
MPSTRTLTTIKWITFGVVVLMLPLMVLLLMQGYKNLEFLRSYANLADAGSGDGKGLKGGDEAIAWWRFLIALEWATLGAVALLGIFAFVAGAGRSWARAVCTVLIVFPVAVIIFGVIDSGEEGLWGLVFLVPFLAAGVLWWLPRTSGGLRARAARRPVP